ncbi:DNA polymerase-4 [Alicyclobacillus vulcanalis]|uniref:DNA polymerase IV n=2 Tax=Alicyclobacillus vulcanalis TaxID=252246 RepID=A0A1N7K2B0_9BACL|nr:DNA polymerase-4 [Alicyclobacillus vulcanalis]
MNAFYASCHVAEEPERYAGRPIAVAGDPATRHGVVVTASYEARARGVKPPMPVQRALARCPDLVLVRPNFDLYRSYARRVFALVREFTPDVEIVSIDECFAEVTRAPGGDRPLELARRLQGRILDELRLPSSVGVAPNKFLAKMASDMNKPMGITELNAENMPLLLWPLPIEHMHGVGPSTARRLRRIGVQTIGDLAVQSLDVLGRVLGPRAAELKARANGVDPRPLETEPQPPKSVGHSITLAVDARSFDEVEGVVMDLCDRVTSRMRRYEVMGRVVAVSVRDRHMRTMRHQDTLPKHVRHASELFQAAKALFLRVWPSEPVRLLGVSVEGLVPLSGQGVQLSLWDTAAPGGLPRNEKLERLERVMDEVRAKFGPSALRLARSLSGHKDDVHGRGTSLERLDDEEDAK